MSNEWNLFFEFAHLSRISHEGWKMAGVDHPQSVAEHSLRAAQIGYVLAHMEGYEDPNEVATMLVFHDIGECRIGDIHKVAKRYVEADEERAVRDQLEPLGEIGEGIFGLWQQVHEKKTTAGIIAKDADYLEMAAAGKEYLEQGYAAARDWLDNIAGTLKTESARALMGSLMDTTSTDWWYGLKKLT